MHLYYRDALMHTTSTLYASRIQRFRLPRVCVAVVGEDPNKIIDKAESLVRDNSFMEFRLDYHGEPFGRVTEAQAFPRHAP